MIHVFGSICRDLLLTYPGHFDLSRHGDGLFNLSIVADSMVSTIGGTAVNIVYNLHLLGVPACPVGSVGADSTDIRAMLESRNINTRYLIEITDRMTATAIIATDVLGHQVSIFAPGAMVDGAWDAHVDWEAIPLAVISAGFPAAQIAAVRQCKRYNIPYVYNPGQSLADISSIDLLFGLSDACAVIVNEMEYSQLKRILGTSPLGLLRTQQLLAVTRAANGSEIMRGAEHVSVPAANCGPVINPTGAGDGYTAGFVTGLIGNQPLSMMGRMASLAGAYPTTCRGTIEHEYSIQAFMEQCATGGVQHE